MSFIATKFVFNGIPSEELGLLITSLDSGDSSSQGGNDITLITQKVFKRPVPYFYGVTQDQVLEFDVEFSSPDEIDAQHASIIQAILFGQMNYRELKIIQSDMETIHMNCFLTKPTIRKIGGQIVGFRCTVVCDSPWAWEYEKSKLYSYAIPIGLRTDTQILNNASANNYYTFPIIVITMNNSGGYLHMTNTTDNSRYTTFDTLLANEVLTVDCDRQILSSSTLLRRISNFNLIWPRLLPGRNDYSWSGMIASIEFKYSNAVRIGG
jgi:phage-related protein